MQREGQALVPHGNLLAYDPQTGVFMARFDFQAPEDPVYTFTPKPVGNGADEARSPGWFVDQAGLIWFLVR